MKTFAGVIFILCGLLFSSYAREIPIRAEADISAGQLFDIYTGIAKLEDGIQIFEVLDSYDWFVEYPHEGSAIQHPYIRLKEERKHICTNYNKMSSSEFSIRLKILQALIIDSHKRGLEERNRLKSITNQRA